MKELIYTGTKVEELIKKQFPTAKIVDASDDIHTERFEVDLDVTEEAFYRFAIRNGFAGACFVLLCRSMQNDKEVGKWIKEEST